MGGVSAAASPGLSRQYVKLCDRPDFDDPALRAKLREMVAPVATPHEELRRKYWEYAMLGLYLEEVGALREDASALAVAAGHEEPLYWLANRVGHVLATDIYGEGVFAVARPRRRCSTTRGRSRPTPTARTISRSAR